MMELALHILDALQNSPCDVVLLNPQSVEESLLEGYPITGVKFRPVFDAVNLQPLLFRG